MQKYPQIKLSTGTPIYTRTRDILKFNFGLLFSKNRLLSCGF